jgi:hypothetical protein
LHPLILKAKQEPVIDKWYKLEQRNNSGNVSGEIRIILELVFTSMKLEEVRLTDVELIRSGKCSIFWSKIQVFSEVPECSNHRKILKRFVSLFYLIGVGIFL